MYVKLEQRSQWPEFKISGCLINQVPNQKSAYKSVIRPILTNSTRRRTQILKVKEVKTLRRILNKTMVDRIKNEVIREKCKIQRVSKHMGSKKKKLVEHVLITNRGGSASEESYAKYLFIFYKKNILLNQIQVENKFIWLARMSLALLFCQFTWTRKKKFELFMEKDIHWKVSFYCFIKGVDGY